jgi:hypothetical protein
MGIWQSPSPLWNEETAMFLHEMLLTLGALVCTAASLCATGPLPIRTRLPSRE